MQLLPQNPSHWLRVPPHLGYQQHWGSVNWGSVTVQWSQQPESWNHYEKGTDDCTDEILRYFLREQKRWDGVARKWRWDAIEGRALLTGTHKMQTDSLAGIVHTNSTFLKSMEGSHILIDFLPVLFLILLQRRGQHNSFSLSLVLGNI